MTRVARALCDPVFGEDRAAETEAWRANEPEGIKQNATDVNPWRFALPLRRPDRPPDATFAQRRTLSLGLTGLRPKPGQLPEQQRLRPKQQRLHPKQPAQPKHQRRSQQQQHPKQQRLHPKLQRQVPMLQQRR